VIQDRDSMTPTDPAPGPEPRATARARLSGVVVPVLTPFTRDLAPDAARLTRHGRWLLAQGCAALAPFGTTSEANSLSVDERERLLEHLLGEGVAPDRLLPGTGCCALPDTVRLTSLATRHGCAGVLVLPPFYYKGVSDDGLFRSYAEVIERVGDARLRLYLYHIPMVSQVPVTARLIERLLAAYPTVVAGMKDSSDDWDNTRAMLQAFAGAGFDVFVGSEKHLLANLRHGGVGCITATANVGAAAIVRLFQAWRSPEAETLQRQLDLVRDALTGDPLIPALKQVVAHFVRDPAWRTVRPPLVELPEARAQELVGKLTRLGFEMPV
jgi:4-hydroxy-tetrahydrodipicolinate synthase